MKANEIYQKRVELDKQQLSIFNDMKRYMVEKLQSAENQSIAIEQYEDYETERGSCPQRVFLQDGVLTIRFDEGFADDYHDEDTNALSYEELCLVFDAFCDTIGE